MKKKLKPLVPDWEESEFAKTLEGQILIEIKQSIRNKHFVESVLLSWAGIEQVLLPRLIKFVSSSLKIELPKDLERLNLQSTNLLYLALSHDKDLFDRLEKSREYRNSIVHKMYKQENFIELNKIAKEATTQILETQKEISKRFSGQVIIPSINLYRNGWNDALDQVIKVIDSEV